MSKSARTCVDLPGAVLLLFFVSQGAIAQEVSGARFVVGKNDHGIQVIMNLPPPILPLTPQEIIAAFVNDVVQVREAYQELKSRVRPAPVAITIHEDEGGEPVEDDTPIVGCRMSSR